MAPIRRGRTRSSALSVTMNTPRERSHISSQAADLARYSCAWFTDSAPADSSWSAETIIGPGWTIPFGGDRNETVICDNHVVLETGSRINALDDALKIVDPMISIVASEETLKMVMQLKQIIVQYWDDQTLDGLKDDQTDITLRNLIATASDGPSATAWKSVRDCLGAVRAVISAEGIDSGVKCFSHWDDPATEERGL